ncbi:long-chain fatty acid--CoA ligase [Actinocorallia sp. A-T 12471]|uniref:AMP-dependent synthetase/ligase n=1 Tax=Actinocorallia sp. A-T 12471 TaxID=3089813 RepID=UPI0029D2B0C7|nr:long-chain fatty acid--CoA ligase [Actinocorallia sp. A-T 12471]MDX6740513.1 long-chain fatty acid--CoA ligase [Actinocorallia sp. A-T 12471]
MSTTTAIQEERAAFDAQIAGRTITTVLRETAAKHGDLPAYTDLGGATLTWADVRDRALKTAAGYVALGLQQGEVVALMLSNRSEHILADLGAVHAGGVPSTVYATLAPDQVQYVADNSSAAYAVLEGADQLARWQPVIDQLPKLRKVIVLNDVPEGDLYLSWDEFVALGESAYAADPQAAEDRAAAVKDTDTLTLLYTSGTTGNPKGVLITHRMALYEALCSEETAGLPPHNVAVSYLPFAHIADRVISYYLALYRAGHVYFCPDPTQLTTVLREVRPNGFFGVPRIWEKIMAGIQAFLSMETDENKKAAIAGAMAVGREYMAAREYGGTLTPELEAKFKAADEAVLSTIRSLLGLDRVAHAMSAAAPLPIEVARFFSGLGLAILDVYGMTETTGAATANTNDTFKLGTVGRAFPGVELRLAEDGEVQFRATTCTPGYLNRPEATAELYDADGWLSTGDIGVIDEDGFLSIVDRKKELLITAGGENIAPSLVENHLKEHPLIGQALAFGDRKPYVVALLTLDGEVAPVWAQARGIEDTSLPALAKNPLVLEEVGKAVEDANARLARVQQVKKWALLDNEWTAETEELTPTLKLKRRVIHDKYTNEIDGLYT